MVTQSQAQPQDGRMAREPQHQSGFHEQDSPHPASSINKQEKVIDPEPTAAVPEEPVVEEVSGTSAIVFLGAARRAVEKAKTVQELKTVRDKAEAVRQYAKQAGESLAILNHCAEIKLRAERKAGELLRQLQKNPGGRPKKTGDIVSPVSGEPVVKAAKLRRSRSSPYGNLREPPPSLESLGIDKKESSRWQLEASVSEPVFERFVAERNEAKEEITQAALLKIADSSKKRRRPEGKRHGRRRNPLEQAKQSFLRLSTADRQTYREWFLSVREDAEFPARGGRPSDRGNSRSD